MTLTSAPRSTLPAISGHTFAPETQKKEKTARGARGSDIHVLTMPWTADVKTVVPIACRPLNTSAQTEHEREIGHTRLEADFCLSLFSGAPCAENGDQIHVSRKQSMKSGQLFPRVSTSILIRRWHGNSRIQTRSVLTTFQAVEQRRGVRS